MSFQELAITIRAVNLASAEFSRVSADAARMASEISGQTVTINVENLASPELARISTDAARVTSEASGAIVVRAEDLASPKLISIGDYAKEAAIGAASASEGFQAAAIEANAMGEAVRAAAPAFAEAASMAETVTISFRTVASAFSSISRFGAGVIALAGDLGLVDREAAKWARTMLYAFTITGGLIRMINGLTVLTTGHSAAITLNTSAQSANAGSSLALAAAYKVKAAATWMATAAQNALNISHATFLALTGVGIGVILAAAAAMAYFASKVNAATASVRDYNAALGETPAASSRLIRLGAIRSEELLRRGVEP